MDQIKIGKFIADCRKEKNMTQRQLADILEISDKTISKWECGKGLPEVQFMIPLCDLLGINVNELLSGEKLSADEYQKKAEENMMSMIKEREENKKKVILTTITGLIATVAFITLILVVCVYTEVMTLSVKIVLVCIACGIFVPGLIVAMEGDRTIGYYKCKACGELFIPTFGEYTLGMHMLTTRYLRCPKCGKVTWCKKVLSKDL